MKKFLSILKVICSLMISVEILFLALPTLLGLGALLSPSSYINTSSEGYEAFKLSIIVVSMCLLLIFLIILISRNKITRKTNDKNIIYICILIVIYYVFIVREQIIDSTNINELISIIIPLIPMGLTFIYIGLKNILLKDKDIEK